MKRSEALTLKRGDRLAVRAPMGRKLALGPYVEALFCHINKGGQIVALVEDSKQMSAHSLKHCSIAGRSAEEARMSELLPKNGESPLTVTYQNLGAPLHCRRGLLFAARDYPSTIELVAGLEALGWQRLEDAALCKWNRYPHRPVPCSFKTASETPQRLTATSEPDKWVGGWPMFPLWFIANQHGQPEMHMFMKSPDDEIFEIQVGAPWAGVSASAECAGVGPTWKYYNVKLHCPNFWHVLPASVALSQTGQDLEARVYFPHSAAAMVHFVAGLMKLSFTTEEADRAKIARIEGVWDQRDLLRLGALSTLEYDLKRIDQHTVKPNAEA